MKVELGIAPIAWWNDDLEELDWAAETDTAIILLQACLLAVQNFKQKSFQCLDEILSFLNDVVFKLTNADDTMKFKRFYNDNLQLILLLSSQILFTSIDYEMEKEKKKALKRQLKTGLSRERFMKEM